MITQEKKGITLISLAITIIVLMILASISTYTGISSVQSSRFTRFQKELEIMQAQVNLLYEKYKDEINIDIGKEIVGSEQEDRAKEAFLKTKVTNVEEYKLFDTETIKSLDIEGIEQEYLVNIKDREVISLDGFEKDGEIYYNLYQITGNENTKGTVDRGNVTFSVNVEKIVDEWEITISNIKYSKYVGKGTIKYKNIEKEKWTTVEQNAEEENQYRFKIKRAGTYTIKVTDAANIVNTQEITLEETTTVNEETP